MTRRTFLSFVVDDPGIVVTEYLRSAGLVRVTGNGHTGYVPEKVKQRLLEVIPYPREITSPVIVTMECPAIFAPDSWASRNAERLADLGVRSEAWKEWKINPTPPAYSGALADDPR